MAFMVVLYSVLLIAVIWMLFQSWRAKRNDNPPYTPAPNPVVKVVGKAIIEAKKARELREKPVLVGTPFDEDRKPEVTICPSCGIPYGKGAEFVRFE